LRLSVPDYLISTPENVDLYLEFAGIGNRILASLTDSAISLASIGLLYLGAALAPLIVHNLVSDSAQSLLFTGLLVIVSFASFLILFGYYIFFETIWNGQTPGKRLCGIRVVDANGQPCAASAIWIRNLVRTVDLTFCFVGVLSMLVDRNERRLGDFAANTIVIRERQVVKPPFKITTALSESDHIDAGLLSPQEYELLQAFLARRWRMSKEARPLVAGKLAAQLRSKTSSDIALNAPEEFLEKVYLSYQARAES
jgi:uncharacterized RDD family membrane protein YckC